MDFNLIKKIIKLVEQSDIAEFSVQEGDLKIRISKNAKTYHAASIPSSVEIQRSAETVPVKIDDKEISHAENKTESVDSKFHEIRSPIVGTFYRSPSPDAEPFVKVGDTVSQGTVLCIVEAMKLMNEIESDINGKIVKVLIENTTPVEYNQPLFLIEKV